jgi:hypothetical protein
MTAYVAGNTETYSSTAGTSAPAKVFALAPQSFEVKLMTIEYGIQQVGTSGTNYQSVVRPSLWRYTSGSASGGAALTPIALRQGSAAASATSRFGSGTSVTGTGVYIATMPPLGVGNYGNIADPALATYTFPADFTVSPGSVLSFQTGGFGAGGDGTIGGVFRIFVYFEELRLTWPY